MVVRLVILLNSIVKMVWLNRIYKGFISRQLSTTFSCSIGLSFNLLISGWKGIIGVFTTHANTSFFSKNFHLLPWIYWFSTSGVTECSIHCLVLLIPWLICSKLKVSTVHIKFLCIRRLRSTLGNCTNIASLQLCCAGSHRRGLSKDKMGCSKVVAGYLSLFFRHVSCFECLTTAHGLL